MDGPSVLQSVSDTHVETSACASRRRTLSSISRLSLRLPAFRRFSDLHREARGGRRKFRTRLCVYASLSGSSTEKIRYGHLSIVRAAGLPLLNRRRKIFCSSSSEAQQVADKPKDRSGAGSARPLTAPERRRFSAGADAGRDHGGASFGKRVVLGELRKLIRARRR
jgi:hypothetical protein